jgi:NAD/NADP transhydrogenase alpha subunit
MFWNLRLFRGLPLEEVGMGSTDWLYYVVDVLGVILLGLAIAYGIIVTSRRKRDAVGQAKSSQGAREVYKEEEHERQKKEPS